MLSPGSQGNEGAARPRRGWSRRRALLLILLVVLGAILVTFTYQATRTYVALRQTRADVVEMQRLLGNGDVVAAKQKAGVLHSHALTAKNSSDGVLWDAVSRVPWLGENAEAVQTMSRVLANVSQRPLEVALTLLNRLDNGQLQPKGGRFDVEKIRETQPLVGEIAVGLTAADKDLGGLDPRSLLGPVGNALADLQDRLGSASGAARSAHNAVRLLPDMLGADGSRNFLLVVQNNAEARSTGGLPGSFSVMRARNGEVTIGAQSSALDLLPLDRPAIALTSEELRLFGPTMAEDVRDTTLTPDFPRAAQFLTAIINRRTKMEFDGVISVDPVALSAALRATGPIKVGTDTFTADNVVAKLLNEAYQRFDDKDVQDEYFAESARGITDALLRGGADESSLVREIGASVGQRRILVWSKRPSEQRLLEKSSISGSLPRDRGPSPHVGIYLNDAASGKLQYYLNTVGKVQSSGCDGVGRQAIRARLDLTSTVPTEPSGLSRWITGFGGIPKGDMRLNLRLYAPAGGRLTGLSVNGVRARIAVRKHDGRQVSVLALQIKPGERKRVAATFQSRPDQRGRPVLTWTPGVDPQPTQLTAPNLCG